MTKLKVIQAILAAALICSVLFLLPHTASAEGPTHAFYGSVSSGGTVVGEGYVVTAMVNGKEVASATTDAQGKWGYSPTFIVAIGGCALVDFYINGELVGSASSCIATNELNLAASGPRRSSASTAATSSTAFTPAPTVSGTAESTPSLSAEDIDSPSASQTTTFFIGPQPSSSSSPSDSPLSPSTRTPVFEPPSSTSVAAPGSETVLPAADFPTAKTSLQAGDASATTAKAGTPAPVSLTEVLVMIAIVAWSVLIVGLFLAIIRKRPEY